MFEGANDSEGVRCFEKAKAALLNKDYSTAERLGRKALRMLSSSSPYLKDAQELIDRALNPESGKSSSTAFSSSASGTSTFRQRKPDTTTGAEKFESTNDSFATSGATTATSHRSRSDGNLKASSSSPELNPEQEAKCKEILTSRDYYKILGVSKDSSLEDIKKSYRKLALQFHPDKTKCPSAEAAFKEISKAYQCLSNPEAKRHYDTYGSEEDSTSAQCRQQYEAHFMSPEDLFESFFGIHLGRGTFHHTRVFRVPTERYMAQGAERGRQAFNILQILPFIVLIAVSILSSLFNSSSQPPFSFARTAYYHVPRVTHEHRLPYYVTNSFHRSYEDGSKSLREFETKLEMSYYLSECTHEKQRLIQQLQTLRFYGSTEQYRKKSEELRNKEDKSVSCQRYKKLRQKYPNIYESYKYSNSW